MVNNLLPVWKENQSITLFRCYFHINKGNNHILLVDDGKNDDGYFLISFIGRAMPVDFQKPICIYLPTFLIDVNIIFS